MQLTKAKKREIQAALTRHGRRKSPKIVVEGVRALETMLANGVTPQYWAHSREHLTDTGRRFLGELNPGRTPVYECAASDFDDLSDTECSQGLLAVVEWQGYADRLEKIAGASRFVLYLDGVADPGNLGTIVRTAAAFGVDLIALSPDAVEVGNPKAIRSSAGLVFALPVEKIADVEAFFALVKSNRLETYGTAAGGERDIESLTKPDKVCLVLGSEARGLSEDVRKHCREVLAIRTVAGVESLNVAAAGAIFISAIARKLRLL